MFHTSAQNHVVINFIDIFDRDPQKPLKTTCLYCGCEIFVKEKKFKDTLGYHFNAEVDYLFRSPLRENRSKFENFLA